MNPNKHLERSIRPSLRTTAAIVASLDERFSHDRGVAGKEWRELRERLAMVTHAADDNVDTASPADVCEFLFSARLDELPAGRRPRQW